MAWLIPWLLLVHVMSAIAGFGPTFALSIVGAMGGREPQHANFATRISYAVMTRFVYPAAAIQLITGIALILVAGFDLTNRATWWLDIAIILFVTNVAFSYVVQRPRVRQLIDMTSAPPPAGASGPPPGLPELAASVRTGGSFMGILLVLIVFLMVVKPGF
jgi:uncharacterized membrane protein